MSLKGLLIHQFISDRESTFFKNEMTISHVTKCAKKLTSSWLVLKWTEPSGLHTRDAGTEKVKWICPSISFQKAIFDFLFLFKSKFSNLYFWATSFTSEILTNATSTFCGLYRKMNTVFQEMKGQVEYMEESCSQVGYFSQYVQCYGFSNFEILNVYMI